MPVLKDLSSWLWNQTCKETVMIECELSVLRVTEDPRRGKHNPLPGPGVWEKDFQRRWNLAICGIFEKVEEIWSLSFRSPLRSWRKEEIFQESNLKVQVRVRVKAKCVVKMLSAEGILERDQNGQARVTMQGSRGAMRSSLPFIRQSRQDPAEWRGRETPDFLSSCRNV